MKVKPEMLERMRAHADVDWSAIVRRCIERELARRERR
jgi:hypothetical protein